MTRHFPDLGQSFSLVENLLHPIRSTIQIRVVTHYQQRISVFTSQTPFRGETSGWVAKCLLFSQANLAIMKKNKTKQKTKTLISIFTIFAISCHNLCLFNGGTHTRIHLLNNVVDQFNIYQYHMTKNILPFYFNDQQNFDMHQSRIKCFSHMIHSKLLHC